MNNMNRIYNSGNPYQGDYRRILCVCSAGLLRSPTAAWVLSQEPYYFNTRAAGVDLGHALIGVDDVLISWANDIICMDDNQLKRLREMTDKPIYNLSIPDQYAYRDEELISILRNRLRIVYGS